MEVHSVTYKLEEQDLVDFYEFHWRNLRGKFIQRTLFTALPAGLLLGFFIFQETRSILTTVISCFVIIALLWPFVWRYQRSLFKTEMKKQLEANDREIVREERTVTLSKDGVREITSKYETLHRWSGIYLIVDTPNQLFVHTDPLNAVIIPKSVATKTFVQFLKKSLPGEKCLESRA